MSNKPQRECACGGKYNGWVGESHSKGQCGADYKPQREELVEHAGEWHYPTCHFPNTDSAVCECPRGLKPREDWREDFDCRFVDVQSRGEKWYGYPSPGEVKSFIEKVEVSAFKRGSEAALRGVGEDMPGHNEEIKKEERKRTQEIIKGMRKECLPPTNDKAENWLREKWNLQITGYNEALDDFLNNLK